MAAAWMKALPFEFGAVALMHMAMEHVLGMILIHQGIEAFKALVGQIIQIAIALCRGMRHQDIETVPKGDGRPHLTDPAFHFFFRIHKGTVMIAHGAAKSQDP